MDAKKIHVKTYICKTHIIPFIAIVALPLMLVGQVFRRLIPISKSHLGHHH